MRARPGNKEGSPTAGDVRRQGIRWLLVERANRHTLTIAVLDPPDTWHREHISRESWNDSGQWEGNLRLRADYFYEYGRHFHHPFKLDAGGGWVERGPSISVRKRVGRVALRRLAVECLARLWAEP